MRNFPDFVPTPNAPANEAPVSGIARSFVSGAALKDAIITAYTENGEAVCQVTTNINGIFGPIMWPVGKTLILELKKEGSWWIGYRTTQTVILTVPPEGFNDPNPVKNISFQVPSNMAITFLARMMGYTENKEAGQIAATITRSPTITLDDIPQGEAGVEVSLSPDPGVKPFYCGMLPLIHKTNFLTHHLTSTSPDGGVIWVNVPQGTYTIKAKKDGALFREVNVTVRKGVLVNASPPQGPALLSGPLLATPHTSNYFNFFNPLRWGMNVAKSATHKIATACCGNENQEDSVDLEIGNGDKFKKH